MIRTQRRSAPAEEQEDATASFRLSKTASVRGAEADEGRLSATEERRNVEAGEDEAGKLNRPETERSSRPNTTKAAEDAMAFSGGFKPISEKKITDDFSYAFFAEGKKRHFYPDPLTVSTKYLGDVKPSSDFSKMDKSSKLEIKNRPGIAFNRGELGSISPYGMRRAGRTTGLGTQQSSGPISKEGLGTAMTSDLLNPVPR